MELSKSEMRRALWWALGCDGESFIDERDWPLIEKLAAAIGVDPSSAAPNYALDQPGVKYWETPPSLTDPDHGP